MATDSNKNYKFFKEGVSADFFIYVFDTLIKFRPFRYFSGKAICTLFSIDTFWCYIPLVYSRILPIDISLIDFCTWVYLIWQSNNDCVMITSGNLACKLIARTSHKVTERNNLSYLAWCSEMSLFVQSSISFYSNLCWMKTVNSMRYKYAEIKNARLKFATSNIHM